jgi:hypothetical protein
MADDMTRKEFVDYMKAFEARFEARMNAQFEETRRDIRMDMKVPIEDVRRDVRLSFEAVETLRDTTERGFADMRTQHHQQTTLLQAAIEHVRARVERIERRK